MLQHAVGSEDAASQEKRWAVRLEQALQSEVRQSCCDPWGFCQPWGASAQAAASAANGAPIQHSAGLTQEVEVQVPAWLCGS